ncbi:MAG: CusA/CzcA family heavy metal efflux RND transporter [Flavobacteriales bacterium]|nr:CusA/CzcA family heavy metal efflux RND transporter [Flavobacteriales bacterium]
MINQIIKFSIHNKLLIGFFTIALIAGGIWSVTKVPLDAVPDITNNQVQVITQSPNLGTEEIEQFVTYPVEVAMSNLPGVTEIRSVSRFGLSLVTIVFEDDMGTYLPRQLVSEKLQEVKQDIPQGFGEPEMGPISTGLGEIYQYTLQVDSAHKGEYSSSDLREMQDWIIRRQMAMVPGVIEVNAFGGDVKQYEVAIDPDRLRAMEVTITEVYQALEMNNQNTGGAYIEKDHYANFIRGEGLAKNKEDIEQIVVKNVNGIPITIKDVAKVQYGKAIRYGTLTMDGEGEAVGGMILMLKGANSNDVIKAVKDRVEEIQKSLPEGVSIVPFLDRSNLIKQTTATVSKNLLEGALIVIFVLVFLLGNWRGGLIVASTIPLSLLFAFIMMHFFGVWANLMSLGAIDFGIIVDGAVIIVEGTVFLLQTRINKGLKIAAEDRDELAGKASGKMMNAAFFGQLIILIVFIPILALQGIEGKMFQPMALTFMFAMIGVMILCLTYVPMMSAWLLRPSKAEKKSLGDRLVRWLENAYQKILNGALKASVWIVGGAAAALAIAFVTFSNMGGEFMPKLDEGDLAFHAILKPGSSLTETVETTTKIEKIVKSNFPEVKHIISRIGVADVPTDPMPMDIADIFVILKPESEWTTVSSKAELIRKMKEKVEILPGINFEFSQPIEMRFNELITGVREDIAVKLFGDDLDVLAEKVEEIGRLIAPIDGVGDMKVEATNGLPQITIRYDRLKLAQYGLHVEELNAVVQAAFAGRKTGVIFEGERRFDLVVRLDKDHRQSIENLKNLFIDLPNGSQIPLKEVAVVDYEPGPMQISRDNTNRRAYVGINVRGRDVQSLVEEIKMKLDAELDLPPGYYIRYGGAFENLQRATNKLKVVVPIALGLIFLLIFLALRSFKQSIMIYAAIPLAAIGGVFFLWLRGMPFSISAGVGFIVLFGVAVLNGLVLINGWNELKAEGVGNLNERIALGAKRRIRPILLTALTDILGFLPMAISSSAGAEVQQPLATVVIGGMISATLLTLFVLPILYKWTEMRSSRPKVSLPASAGAILLVLGLSGSQALWAQEKAVHSADEAIEIAMQNNAGIKLAKSQIEFSQRAKSGAFNPGKTEVGIQYGQYNSFENDVSFGVDQKFQFPTVYANQNKLAKEQISADEFRLGIEENSLKKEIRKSWYELGYLQQERDILRLQDSLLNWFVRATELQAEVGDVNELQKISAEAELLELKNELQQNEADIKIQEQQLKLLLQDSTELAFEVAIPEQLKLSQDSLSFEKNPLLAWSNQQIEISRMQTKVETSKMLPDISVGYFNQSMIGNPLAYGSPASSNDRFMGVKAGLTVPIFFGAYRSQIKMAEIEEQKAQTTADYYYISLSNQLESLLQEVIKYERALEYYTTTGIPFSEKVIDNAMLSYQEGAIGYVEYLHSFKQAIQMKRSHAQTLNDYNQAVIDLNYVLGQ